jgi:hypothetical protein
MGELFHEEFLLHIHQYIEELFHYILFQKQVLFDATESQAHQKHFLLLK